MQSSKIKTATKTAGKKRCSMTAEANTQFMNI